jgi:hypothetical protein
LYLNRKQTNSSPVVHSDAYLTKQANEKKKPMRN